MRCYTFKDLFEFVGLDWKPTFEMIESVKEKEFAVVFWKPVGDKREYWTKVLDPKEEFYG